MDESAVALSGRSPLEAVDAGMEQEALDPTGELEWGITNPNRRHGNIDELSPMAYEQRYFVKLSAV